MAGGTPQCDVLIVEDDLMVAMHLEMLLEDMGLRRICRAHDLPTAMALLRSGLAPKLALLDVNIGRDLVFPVADALRARGVSVVFCTGAPPTIFPPEWAGARLVAKPIATTALAAEVQFAGLGIARGSA